MSIQLKALTKRFKSRTVLREITLEIPRRAVITGANGVGKTTLLRILAGLSRQDAGEIVLPCKQSEVAFVSGETFLYPMLSVRENLRLYAKEPLDSLIEKFKLRDKIDSKVETLSAGQKVRVSLVRALATSPRVLCLDEPLSPLDAEGRELLVDILESFPGEVVLTSHDVEQFPGFSRLVMMNGELT